MLFCILYLDTDSRINRFLKNKIPEWLQISMSITSMGQGSLKMITINDNHMPLRLSHMLVGVLIHSTDIYRTLPVFQAPFYVFPLELMDSHHVICPLTSEETTFTVADAPWHHTVEGPTFCVSSLGNNYHAEVKIISKALLCVCKHKAARHMITVGSEHSERKL